MQNLVFDEGYREFTINNDETRVIRFNPSDFAIITRLNEAKTNIEKAMDIKGDIELDDNGKPVDNLENSAKIVDHIGNVIKEQIDYIFNDKVSDKVFGNQSPLTNIKGLPLYVRFIDCVTPVLKEAMTEEREKSKKRVSKYTKVVK